LQAGNLVLLAQIGVIDGMRRSDTPTRHVVLGSAQRSIYGGALQLVPWSCQGRGGNREPGVNPGLPRSGKWERTPSSSTGSDQPGKRRLL